MRLVGLDPSNPSLIPFFSDAWLFVVLAFAAAGFVSYFGFGNPSDGYALFGFAIGGSSILLGLLVGAWDVFCFLRSRVWEASTLLSLTSSHLPWPTAVTKWRGLLVVYHWIFDHPIALIVMLWGVAFGVCWSEGMEANEKIRSGPTD